MRFLAVTTLALALTIAGCVAPTASDVDAAAADSAADAPALVVTEWSGHVLHSAVDGPSHFRPTEDVLWPVQQEGFLFDVTAIPQIMEVALEWSGDGEFMIMLHSHKADGTNAYVEHITEMDATNPKCLRVPTEDLAEGEWQVMIHNRNAVDVPFTIRVGLVGGAGAVVEDDRHGHWPQDGAFSVDEHPIEECALLTAA